MSTHLVSSVAASEPPESAGAPGFRAAGGGGNTRSGTLLLVEAYAAIWLLVFALILWTLRRQRRMNARIARLEQQLGRTRPGDAAQPNDETDSSS